MKAQGMALKYRSNQAAQATTTDAVTMKAIKTLVTTAVAVATTVLLMNIVDVPKTELEPPALSTASVQEVQPEVAPVTPAETVTETEPQTETLPEPTPQPVAVAPADPCEQYRPLFEKYQWDVATAMAIMQAESTTDTDGDGVAEPCAHLAQNNKEPHDGCNVSYGLMQVACFWADFYNIPREALLDPATNVDIAYRVYQRSGSFYPWTTWTSGKYKQYL